VGEVWGRGPSAMRCHQWGLEVIKRCQKGQPKKVEQRGPGAVNCATVKFEKTSHSGSPGRRFLPIEADRAGLAYRRYRGAGAGGCWGKKNCVGM